MWRFVGDRATIHGSGLTFLADVQGFEARDVRDSAPIRQSDLSHLYRGSFDADETTGHDKSDLRTERCPLTCAGINLQAVQNSVHGASNHGQ